MKNKLIIAHRGDSSQAVENTLDSFRKAIELGADMIELDVRKTKDDILVVHHSRNIRGKRIRKLNWENIKKINGRRNFEIPTLEDVIKIAKGKIRVDIELKEEGYEGQVLKVLGKYFCYEEFIITSFSRHSLAEIKKSYPKVNVGLLLGVRKPRRIISAKLREFIRSRKHRLSFVDYLLPHLSLVKLGFLERAKKHNKPVIVWTVNGEKNMKKLFRDSRVEGIITDRVKTALEIRKDGVE